MKFKNEMNVYVYMSVYVFMYIEMHIGLSTCKYMYARSSIFVSVKQTRWTC